MYLGLLLGAKASSRAIWNPIIERMEKHLAGWKGRYLSKVGKLVLLKSVFSILPIYFPSLFVAHMSVLNRMEQISVLSFSSPTKREGRLTELVVQRYVIPWPKVGWVLDLFLALLNKWLWRFRTKWDAL